MSMSTYVVGFRPPDDRWQKMKDIWDSCAAANVPPPDEVGKFFGWEDPDPRGIEIEIEDTEAVKEWFTNGRAGFEVELSKLPPHITHIRFFNAW